MVLVTLLSGDVLIELWFRTGKWTEMWRQARQRSSRKWRNKRTEESKGSKQARQAVSESANSLLISNPRRDERWQKDANTPIVAPNGKYKSKPKVKNQSSNKVMTKPECSHKFGSVLT